MATKAQIALTVSNRWTEYAAKYGGIFSIPLARVLAHICQESKGNQYWLRNDKKAESFYGSTLDEALEKLREWDSEGFDLQKCSVGLMQLVPKYGLADFNAKYGKNYTLYDVLQNSWANIEAGTGYLKILFDHLGNLDDATRAFNVGPDLEPRAQADVYLSRILTYQALIPKS